MRLFNAGLISSVLLFHRANAIPAPVPENGLEELDKRQLLSGILTTLDGLTDPTAILSQLKLVQPASKPTSVEEAQSRLEQVYSATPTNIYKNVANQISEGLTTMTINEALGILTTGENSQTNNNLRDPATPIYPQKSPSDAPYSLSEQQLRQAIYIPPAFTYGQKPPVIFVPGTGAYGGINFASNLRKLLTDVAFADPVWLNVPGALLRDAQTNAEHVAYAINYISGISNSANVSIISWSQGGLDTQWAFTYWPSTRPTVSDFIPVSADFHGTVLANAICLSSGGGIGLGPCAPSVIQQEYTSRFVATLRAAGGADAYVPTTSVFSGFLDEIVQPQSAGTAASAFVGDARGAGATNAVPQVVCAGKGPAAGLYTHESMLANPLTYALVVDALTHDGPGSVDRLDLDSVCATALAPGLGLDDLLGTEGVLVLSAVNLLTYPDRGLVEPGLMAYAAA
ncbi:lipase b precursor [Diplodia corticola]|uniref:Lipase b n=1 Tax=Diplodia corticola TaxID=236234 RepID=A0A1J9R4Z6_9PEZI|nr:lipase b precursor [Diplodia corticola]OJD35633.1 lipase b precursor [Diplodia corticola]